MTHPQHPAVRAWLQRMLLEGGAHLGMPEEFLSAGGAGAQGPPSNLVLGQQQNVIGRVSDVPVQPWPELGGAGVGFPVLLQPPSGEFTGLPGTPPKETGILQASAPDQSSRLYTVTFQQPSLGTTPEDNTQFKGIARGHVRFGAGGFLVDAWIDITRGGVINVFGSTIQTWASAIAPLRDATNPPTVASVKIGTFVAEHQRALPSKARVTEPWVTAAGSGINDIISFVPPFATDVYITRIPGTVGFPAPTPVYPALSILFYSGLGAISPRLIDQILLPAGTRMSGPILIPNGTTYVEVDFDTSVDENIMIDYGLTL